MTATAKPTTTSAKGAVTPADAIRRAREAGVQVVDVRFTDLPGTWQHFSIPVSEMTEALFAEGIGFDGSSIRGFQAINESDMLLFPDPASAFVDPCLTVPTLSLTCDIGDPITGERYSRDPRYVAQKAEAYLAKTGIADTVYYGPEAEFYIFNSARYDQNAHEGYYFIDSEEGIWNSGAEGNGTPNLGHRPRHKEGYFPVPPTDKQQDLRSKIMLAMIGAGIPVEVHHHEVGTDRRKFSLLFARQQSQASPVHPRRIRHAGCAVGQSELGTGIEAHASSVGFGPGVQTGRQLCVPIASLAAGSRHDGDLSLSRTFDPKIGIGLAEVIKLVIRHALL